MVNGREYHGLVYSATDDGGNKVGNPFKASCIGKSVGYEAVQRRFEFSNGQIRDRRLAEMTRKTVAAVLDRTYRKDEFVALLKAKGVDVVFRHTDGKGASTGRPSSTTARAACSTAPGWAGNFPPMPCRSTSLCRMRTRRRCRSPLHGTNRRRKPIPMWNTARAIPRAWACLAATLRAHRRRKPLSSATSNAGGRNAGRVWDYKLSVRRASKQRSDLWLSKVRPLVARTVR